MKLALALLLTALPALASAQRAAAPVVFADPLAAAAARCEVSTPGACVTGATRLGSGHVVALAAPAASAGAGLASVVPAAKARRPLKARGVAREQLRGMARRGWGR